VNVVDLGASLELQADDLGVEADRALDVADVDAVLAHGRRHVATLGVCLDTFQIRLVHGGVAC
jgi:hypothetical protein